MGEMGGGVAIGNLVGYYSKYTILLYELIQDDKFTVFWNKTPGTMVGPGGHDQMTINFENIFLYIIYLVGSKYCAICMIDQLILLVLCL